MKNLIAVGRLALAMAVVAVLGISSASAGHPLPNAEVIVVKQGSKQRFVARTDDAGGFSLRGLPAGEYTVSVPESSSRSFAAACQPGGSASKVSMSDLSVMISVNRRAMGPLSVNAAGSGVTISVGADGILSGRISCPHSVEPSGIEKSAMQSTYDLKAAKK